MASRPASCRLLASAWIRSDPPPPHPGRSVSSRMVVRSVCVLLLSCVASSAAALGLDPPPPHPNLRNIFIMFGDDVGYGDLSSFGHPTSKTPHLDEVARTGSKLVQYLSAASICSPSRGSLMTGRMFTRLGIYPGVFSPTSISGLSLNETTIATSLKSIGWTTGMVGKWHLGTNEYHPTNHGFDYYYGAHMTQNECVSSIRTPGAALVAGINANYSTGPGNNYGACPIFNGSTDQPVQQYDMLATPPRLYDMNDVDDQYDEAAASFIRAAHAKKQQWFFYFASHHTHVPQFGGIAETGYTLRGLQGDSLSLLDRSVGRITALLDELDIASETLFVFSADNGGARYW